MTYVEVTLVNKLMNNLSQFYWSKRSWKLCQVLCANTLSWLWELWGWRLDTILPAIISQLPRNLELKWCCCVLTIIFMEKRIPFPTKCSLLYQMIFSNTCRLNTLLLCVYWYIMAPYMMRSLSPSKNICKQEK